MAELNMVQITDANMVIQANEILRSHQDQLTLLETKLLRVIISQAFNDSGKANLTYTCNARYLAEELGVPSQNVYRDLDKLSTDIMKKIIYLKTEGGKKGKPNYLKIHWVDYFQYCDGVATVKLSDELQPYISSLHSLFTRYPITEIMKLPTTYSVRLFELVSSWANIKFDKDFPTSELRFSIDYLRDFFGTGSKYSRPFDFVRRIIDPSVTAIRENTMLPLSYQVEQWGGSITHIVFSLSYDAEQSGMIIRRLIKAEEGDTK